MEALSCLFEFFATCAQKGVKLDLDVDVATLRITVSYKYAKYGWGLDFGRIWVDDDLEGLANFVARMNRELYRFVQDVDSKGQCDDDPNS